MKTIHLTGFKGLDLRNIDEVTDPLALREGVNVDVTVGGGIKSRAQLRPYTTVAANSLGLYVGDGALRAAIPYKKNVLLPRTPYGVRYDYLGHGSNGWTGDAPIAITAAGNWRGDSYIVVKREVNAAIEYEHHYMGLREANVSLQVLASGPSTTIHLANPLDPDYLGASSPLIGSSMWFISLGSPTGSFIVQSITDSTHIVLSAPVTLTAPLTEAGVVLRGKTKVGTPFSPGPAMLVHADRVWAGAIDDNNTWFCAIGEPTNWTDTDDTGFIPTSTHVDGAQPMRGIYVFKNSLCVFFKHAVQAWDVSQRDPATFAMLDSVGGAGTDSPKSVVNALGDLIYFSSGAFHALSAVVTTGQLKDGDIGAYINELTQQLQLANLPPLVALWSQTRAQYMCAAGRQVFVLTNSPVSETRGWTTYALPWEVSDMVEWEGRVYVRRANSGEVYVFDETYTEEPGFTWTWRLPYNDFDTGHYIKQFKLFMTHQTGVCNMQMLFDPSDPTDADEPVEIGEAKRAAGKAPLHATNDIVAFKFTGTTPCLIDEIIVRFDVGNIL